MPAYTSVLPDVAARPLFAVNVIPRLILRLKLSVACKVPPFNVIESDVSEPGAAPKLESEFIDKMPAVIVVLPA